MHFTISTRALKQAIDTVNHASSATNTTPILENILIQAQYQRVVFTANNLEMAIEYTIDQDIEIRAEGSFTLSSRFLTSFIALQQDDRIEVRLVGGGSVEFRTASSQTRVKGVDAAKFPLLPSFRVDDPMTIGSAHLRQAFARTLFSVSDGNVRPSLAGVYVSVNSESMLFASTDSFRLSEYMVRRMADIPKPITMTIPTKTASEISRILEDGTEIRMYVSDNQLLLVSDGIRIFSRLLSGHFPDYAGFFPKGHATKGVIRRQELINALKKVNLISRQNNFSTRFAFRAETGLEIVTGDTEIGAAEERLTASIEGEDATVGMNSTYLLEVLSVIREDYISIDFETNLSPILIRGVPETTGDATYRHIIMPLKI